MRHLTIRKYDNADCGPKTVAAIAAFHGYPVSLAGLRDAAMGGDRTGIEGIVRAAVSAGFTPLTVRATPEALSQLHLPAIARWQDYEPRYVVLYRIGAKDAIIADPKRGLRRLSMDDFRRCWTGVLVLLTPCSGIPVRTPPPSNPVPLSGPHRPLRGLLLSALFAAALILILSLTYILLIHPIALTGAQARQEALSISDALRPIPAFVRIPELPLLF
jgi:ABC-type bacteriocin/lantibiotic exporter with double-glycine peptidase domain